MITTIDPEKVHLKFHAEKESYFQEDKALALLLINEVVFLNSNWWMKEHGWPEDACNSTALCVNCNDTFAWGCADAEPMLYDDLETVFNMWKADNRWGADKWCAIKRNQKPQPPVIEAMKKDGSWDETMENLGANYQDAQVLQAMKELASKNASSVR